MDLTLTADQEDLRARARALTETIKAHEEACEAGNGLPAETLHEIADRVRELRLNAINMPAEWGGQGLSVLDQVLVQEELGRLTNALWDAVWRPANALRACTPEQREEYLIPAIRGQRRDWFVEERLMIAARTVGAAERALRTAVEFAGGREQFGAPIIDYQLIQGMVADSVVDIATNRALVRQGGWEADQGMGPRLLHGKAAVVKLSASEAAGRVVDRALQIDGDIHEMFGSVGELAPHLEEPWRSRITMPDGWAGLPGFPYSYPQVGGLARRDAVLDDRRAPRASYERLREQVLGLQSVQR